MFGSTGFGATPSTFGTSGFGAATSAGGSVFGQPAQQQPTTSLFGGGGTAFGGQQTSLPAFGAGGGAGTAGAFGAQPQTSSVFGQQARPTTGIFNSTANTMSPFSAQTQVAGTSIPFNAITGTDTMMKNGAASQINTRHQCITCMKEYENKSLEELRLEDYQLNRKGPSNPMFGGAPGAVQPGQPQPGTSLFSGIGGATGATSVPGTSSFGQTSAFGQTGVTGGGGLFSSLNQPKPGGFFGSTATPTSTGFGGGSTLGGFSFNNPTSQPQQSIFGQNNNPATSNTGGLGTNSAFSFATAQPQPQQQQGLGLFGQKPLTTPASSAPTFGTGFGAAATNTGLNKPLFGGATGATGFGGGSAAPTFGTGTASLFSTNQQQQQKPFTFSTPFSSTQATSQPGAFGGVGTSSTSTFSFSNPVSTPSVSFGAGTTTAFGGGTGAPGTTSTFGAPLSFSLGGSTQQPTQGTTGTSTFGTGFFSSGATNTGGGTGLSLFGSSGNTGGLGGGGFGASSGLGLQPQQQLQLQQQQQQQQQQIGQGAITFATTPFKDNLLFYNLISNRKLEDMSKPTNPQYQRQFREASRRKTSTSVGPSSSLASFNISMSPAVKSLTYATSTKNSSISKFKIFDGFEDEDYGVGIDILSPKTDVKKLVLRSSDIIASSSSNSSPTTANSNNGENAPMGMARRASLLAGTSSPLTNSSLNNRQSLQSPLTQNRRNRLTLNNSSMNHSDLSYLSPNHDDEREERSFYGGGGGGGEPNRTIDFGDSYVSNEGAGSTSNLNNSVSSEGGDGGYTNGGILNGGGFSSKRGSDIDGSYLNGGSAGQSSPSSGGGVCGVICTRASYFLKPSLEELDKMVDGNGNCIVKGLEIGRVNFGRIRYLEPVNIANINIDQIVQFRHKEITVYPDDINKPELGRGLNVPAEIELDRVWPIDRTTNELIRNVEDIQKLDYENKLRKSCNRTGAEFISYNITHGTWKFKVPHFSKYSCDVEEDEEDPAAVQKQQQKGLGGISQQKLQQQKASMGLMASGGAAAGGPGPSGGGGAGDGPSQPMQMSRMSMAAHYSGGMGAPPMPSIPSPPLPPHLMEGGPQSDVELNPLTPCDSDDEDDDDLDDDDGDDDIDERDLVIRRPSVRMSLQPTQGGAGGITSPSSEGAHLPPGSLPKYKPILKDCGTEKSRLMKSVMSIDDYGEADLHQIMDSQPPSKKRRPQSMMILSNYQEYDFPEESQRLKKRLTMIQEPVSAVASHHQAVASSVNNKPPPQTVMTCEPIQFDEENEVENVFKGITKGAGIQLGGCSRVCFLPNGSFVTVVQNTNRKTAGFKGEVKIKQLVSYADKQEGAAASSSYRLVLEKQMQDRLEKEGVLFQDHLDALREVIRRVGEGGGGKAKGQAMRSLKEELVIWELCDILWPGENDIDGHFLEDDGFLLEQRKRLGDWLRRNASVLFGGEYDGGDTSVLGYLKKGLIECASDEAIKQGNLWLAVVLETSPYLMLDIGEGKEVLEGMPKDMSDVFALVSGNMRNLSWLSGEKVLGMTTHDWLQHFALFVWYEGPVRTQLPVSVEKAVREYEELMRIIGGDDECPLPSTETSTIANLAMHLLKMYSCTGYPMNVVLSPRTWSLDCLDYKLDWLLMRNLEEIGYSPGDDLYRDVCLSFTGMLEGIGKWQWCHFVMGHLPGPDCEAEGELDGPEAIDKERKAREVFCQRLLERNIGEMGMSVQDEMFLVRQLGVDEQLIYAIKSWKSGLPRRKRPDEVMWYLGNMKKWQDGFNLLTKYMESGQALDLIGSRLPALAHSIQSHLKRLEDNRSRIVGWDVMGKMVTNYLRMLYDQEDVDRTEQAVINFTGSVVKFTPVNTNQCAFLLDMALSAQKMIQLLLAEPEVTQERRSRIETNLVQFLEIQVPNEYFDGLRCFINNSLFNNTRGFRVMPPEEMEEEDGGENPFMAVDPHFVRAISSNQQVMMDM